MSELPPNTWIISDYHGVIAKEKKGQPEKTQLVDHPVTEEFLKHIGDISDNLNTFTYQSFLAQVFSGSEHWSLNLIEPKFNFTQRLIERVLTIGGDGNQNLFFDPFEVTDETVDIIKSFQEIGINITICSGIPFIARVRFLEQINPLLAYLHPDIPAVLRPTDMHDISKVKLLTLRLRGIFSTRHYPTTTSSYVKIGLGKAIQTFSPNTKVVAIEDDTYVARCLSRALGIRVYDPVNKEAALSQPYVSKLEIPESLRDIPDDIVFGISLNDIYKELTNG